jgi:hypothetical protein
VHTLADLKEEHDRRGPLPVLRDPVCIHAFRVGHRHSSARFYARPLQVYAITLHDCMAVAAHGSFW